MQNLYSIGGVYCQRLNCTSILISLGWIQNSPLSILLCQLLCYLLPSVSMQVNWTQRWEERSMISFVIMENCCRMTIQLDAQPITLHESPMMVNGPRSHFFLKGMLLKKEKIQERKCISPYMHKRTYNMS